jgi:hypothetical protein
MELASVRALKLECKSRPHFRSYVTNFSSCVTMFCGNVTTRFVQSKR